jgi:multidrug resistance efflux pump
MDAARDPLRKSVGGRILGAAIVFAAIVSVLWVTRVGYARPRTDDATVRANVVGIASRVSGPITELKVVDDQEVQEGQVLFTIDSRPFEIEVQQAQAQLMLARTQVAALNRTVAEQFVSSEDVEAARAKARASAAGVQQGRQGVAREKALVAQVGQVNAHLAAAEAALRAAQLNVADCTVRAPFPARVTNLNISRGQYARAGQQVFGLVDTRAWYVIANFQETYLDSIRAGMAAEVFLISYPGRRLHGTVEGVGWAVSPADDQTVGVLPQVKPTLNWVRLSQRLPVRIRLEPPPAAHPYRMGMSAVVTVLADAKAPPRPER